jgi:putative PEP-CTERM system TPR-repeat lipoprotein
MFNFNISIVKSGLLIRILPILIITGILTACGEVKDADELISEAVEYQKKGDDKAAMIQLRNALQQEPNNKEARYLLGALYTQNGDPLSAEKELNRALSLGMDSGKVMPVLGKTLFDLREYQQLIDKTEDLSETNISDELLILRGNALLATGESQKAKAIFEKILSSDSNSAGALVGLARHSASERDFESSMKFAETAIAKNPENIEAWTFKADLLRAQGKNDDALVAYEKITRLDPANVNGHINRATIQIALQKFDDARNSIEAAQKISPDMFTVLYTQSLLDFSEGNHAKALESIQQVLGAAPEHLPSVLLAGAIQFSLGSHIQAEQYLESYLKNVPGNIYANKLMASIHIKNRATEKALGLLIPMLDVVKGDPQLFAIAGEAYMQTGDFSKAAEFFEEASEILPNSAPLHTALAMSKLAVGDSDHAIAELELASDLNTGSSRPGILLALTHLRLKEFDKALSATEDLIKSDPNNPLFYNLKGGVFMGKEDALQARASFNKALSLQSDYFPAISNLARLDIQDSKPDMAKKRFEAMLKNDPRNVQAMNALANLAQSQGNKEEATNWLELASNRNPDALEPALQLAVHYLRSDEKEKSLMLSRKLFGTYPNDPRVLEILGQSQLANDNKSAALDSYEKLAAILPDSAAAQLQVASIYAAMDNRSSASAALRRALVIQPDYLEAQVAQVRLAVLNEDLTDALAISRSIQKQHDQSPVGYVLEGELLIGQEKPELATEAFEKAFAITQNSLLMVKLHMAMSMTEKDKQAHTLLTKWLTDHPDDMSARIYAGNHYLGEQQYDAAIKEYLSILQQHPEHVLSLNNLAWLYQQKKDPRALEYAEKAYQQLPESPPILDTLGWILIKQGDTGRGLPLLQKAASLAPDAAEIQYHFAVGLVQSGDKVKARRVLEKLLASDKVFPDIEKARELLKQTQ